MEIINDVLYITEAIESDNNLIPFFDIGIGAGQSSIDTELTIYKDAEHTEVRRIVNNGLILNSTNSHLINSFLNGRVNITASGQTGAGYFTFKYDHLTTPTPFILGKKYAIIFDIEGNPSIDSNIIGFINNDDIGTLYNPSTSYATVVASGSNLNLYYIFTADAIIINNKNSFVFGWSDLTGTTININLTTLQIYNIDGLTEDINILKKLKGTSFCEKKINSSTLLNASFKENGAILMAGLIEGTP